MVGRRHALLVAAFVLPSSLVGCGNGGSTATQIGNIPVAPTASAHSTGAAAPRSSPAPTPVAGPDDTTPLDAEACPPYSGRYDEEDQDPQFMSAQNELDAAAEDIRAYADRHGESFTGIRVCQTSRTLFVYRVAGDRAFDALAAAAVQRQKVKLALEDAPYSRHELERVEATILRDYRDDLERVGADWRSFSVSRLGWLEVGVKGNYAAARLVLEEFGDRVHVVKGTVGAPV
jgi:hypothetical protein